MVLLQSPDSCKAQQEASFCYTYFVPEGVESLSSREFGYLISSARTRITSAITNRQSTAIVIATLIQDDFSSNRPHLLCVGTARRSLSTACGPTAQSSEPIFHRRSHTRKRSSISLPVRGRPIDGIRHSCFLFKKKGCNPGEGRSPQGLPPLCTLECLQR